MIDNSVRKGITISNIRQVLRNVLSGIDKFQSLPEVQASITSLPEPLRTIVAIVLPTVGRHVYESRLTDTLSILYQEIQLLEDSKINQAFLQSEQFKDMLIKRVGNSVITRFRERIELNCRILAGAIFEVGGGNAYDVIILGHQEYVTQREYDNLKRFVGNGRTMIILDGNVFYAEVKFDRNNDIISLVKGHSWAFNGHSAWPSVNERWKNETSQWVGSNYIGGLSKFSNNPFDYFPHEEQYVTNPKDIILLDYGASTPQNSSGKLDVATYELNYLKGNVNAIGLYSDDIITNGSFDRYFDNLLYQYAFRIHD